MRFLHLATDAAFIDYAVSSFERQGFGNNTVLMVGESPRRVQTPVTTISRRDAFTAGMLTTIPSADVIVAHALDPFWLPTLGRLSRQTKILWLGWGYDYYDLVHRSSSALLLQQTREAMQGLAPASLKSLVRKPARLAVRNYKKWLLPNLDFFAPVLPEEYHLVRKGVNVARFPEQAIWNYGHLSNLVADRASQLRPDSNSILVGNSATAESNHLDAFSLITRAGAMDRDILVPLSYGNTAYRLLILEQGRQKFADRFIPLLDHAPLDQYQQTLMNCSHVIMNHVRQQALGNIIMMLHLGSMLFLNPACPTLTFFRAHGAIVHTTADLERDPSLLRYRLTPDEVSHNRHMLESWWGQSASDERTRILLNQLHA